MSEPCIGLYAKVIYSAVCLGTTWSRGQLFKAEKGNNRCIDLLHEQRLAVNQVIGRNPIQDDSITHKHSDCDRQGRGDNCYDPGHFSVSGWQENYVLISIINNG